MLSLGTLLLVREGDKIMIRDLLGGESGLFPISQFEEVVKKYFGDNF